MPTIGRPLRPTAPVSVIFSPFYEAHHGGMCFFKEVGGWQAVPNQNTTCRYSTMRLASVREYELCQVAVRLVCPKQSEIKRREEKKSHPCPRESIV